MAQSTSQQPPVQGSAQVIGRFVVRLAFVGGFAIFSSAGFGRMLAFVTALMAVYAATAASLRQEQMFAPVLTHWDEAAGYALIHLLFARVA